MSLEICTQTKKPYQTYCSGCAKRGHLIHTCRITLPFSGLPINSPHVQFYRPIYAQTTAPGNPARSKSFSEEVQRPDRNLAKRQSKSPALHETHLNKRRNLSANDTDISTKNSAPVQRNIKDVDNTPKNKNKNLNKSVDSVTTTEKALDFNPVNSSNHDNKGRVIQDNEVSDTSDAVTSARIYVTNDIVNKLKTKEGEDWLKEKTGKLNVTVAPADVNSFLSITGRLAHQEVFQTELREWVHTNTNKVQNSSTTEVENTEESKTMNLLPKNRNNLLRHLDNALKSLKKNLGDPRALFKELTYLQNTHEKLQKQKVINPQRLSNNRSYINKMLKTLNTILVGQAGLGGGSQHLSELISFHRKLTSSREKTISMSLRKEINEHYQFIFSSNERNDYSMLVKKYYDNKPAPKSGKKQKKNKQNKVAINVNKQSIPSEDKECVVAKPPHPPLVSKPVFDTINNADCITKLGFFSRRLISLRHSLALPGTKLEMQQLLRRIHVCVAILHQKKKMNSKQTKKVRKVQQDAQKFLAEL